MFSSNHSKSYRASLGFSRKGEAKAFLGAKNIRPDVDYAYIERLNGRLREIAESVNGVLHSKVRTQDMDEFRATHIEQVYGLIRKSDILRGLANHGRRPEAIYFNWMRGHVAIQLFRPALSEIFGIEASAIRSIGGDNIEEIDSFRRTPTADLEIRVGGKPVRLEIQSGFQGVNDVKEHKVAEARRIFGRDGAPTILVHFDIFNGQAAFLRLDQVDEDGAAWITRGQMEGKRVFNISPERFCWLFAEEPVNFFGLDLPRA